MELKYLQDIEEDKKLCYWYGGDILELIVNEDVKFVLGADGEVIGTLYKYGEELTSFKDKCNYGAINQALRGYIDTDADLLKYLCCDYVDKEYLDQNKDKMYILNLKMLNWLELTLYIKGEVYNIDCILDSNDITEGIKEAKEIIDDILSKIFY